MKIPTINRILNLSTNSQSDSPVTCLAKGLGTFNIQTPIKKLDYLDASADSTDEFVFLDMSTIECFSDTPKENLVPGSHSRKRSRNEDHDLSSENTTPLKQIQNLPPTPKQPSKRPKRDPVIDFDDFAMSTFVKIENEAMVSPLKTQEISIYKHSPDSESRDSGISDCEKMLDSPLKFHSDISPTLVSSDIAKQNDGTGYELKRSPRTFVDLIKKPLFNGCESVCKSLSSKNSQIKPETPLTVQNVETPISRTKSISKRTLAEIEDRPSKRPRTQSPKKFCAPNNSFLHEQLSRSMSTPSYNCKINKSQCKVTSEAEIHIKKAVEKVVSATEQLTGDYSRPLALPLIEGAKCNNIDPKTVADLLTGKYSSTVASFKIVDCRYHYEFEGGHIKGAVNWPELPYVKNFIENSSELQAIPPKEEKRDIIIFHCEFSSERGPKALHYIRQLDRAYSVDADIYPALKYPELYLLDGGYKKFFSRFPQLCDPSYYVTMNDRLHVKEKRICMKRAKSYNDVKVGYLTTKHNKINPNVTFKKSNSMMIKKLQFK